MSNKIATPAAVFVACDYLEASGKPWNRDDVRIEVGGGGFNVIDPLIKAWRKLQPVKALAPSTPTELLSQIAETLETHYGGFMEEVQRREKERSKLFESTAAELIERIEGLENHLADEKSQRESLQQERDRLVDQVQRHQAHLQERGRDVAALQAENDELRGQLQRLEQERRHDQSQHREDIKARDVRHDAKIADLLQQHKAELEKQRQHLLEAGEMAENRWVRQLDRARIDSEKQQELLGTQLKESRIAERDAQDQLMILKNQLQRQRDQLDILRTDHEKALRQLSIREQESLSWDELKTSIRALQDQMGTQKRHNLEK